MTPDYSHLQTPVADTRYALAAHYLKSCDYIVEIGGDRLHGILGPGSPHRRYWNVDPGAKPLAFPYGITYNMPVCDFDFGLIPNEPQGVWEKKYGLCILGMEMYDCVYGDGSGIKSVENIAHNMHRFDRIVMDFVPTNLVAKAQSLILLGAAAYGNNFKRTVCMTVCWETPNQEEPCNESFSKPRQFWVLERQYENRPG